MDDAKQQLIDKLTTANNILVTVSRNPSVDQLASCIGLTLLLNKQGKHAAAVFSGKVPSTLEFLEPGETLEKNTDSLRDFIISLDKAKADKLRYKVEEDVVRIFITPYKTSLSEDDLEFSEGDFNVDVVVALGVQQQDDLDQAITAHGRILHDATVTSINIAPESSLGTINWNDPQASSLSELVTDVAQALDVNLLDSQISTALLTGIISETKRFSNDRTSSQTMSASALLLSAGANQQLVASKLENEAGGKIAGADTSDKEKDGTDGAVEGDDGVLNIDHVADTDEGGDADEPPAETENVPPPPPEPPSPEPPAPPPPPAENPSEPPPPTLSPGPKLVTEPPKLGGTLTANSEAEHLDPVTDPLSLPQSEPPALLGRKDKPKEPETPVPPPPSQLAPEASAPAAGPMTPPPSSWSPPTPTPEPPTAPPASPPPAGKTDDGLTLTDLEKSVDSPHLQAADLETVRSEVSEALNGTDPNEPIKALNAQPLGGDLHTPAPVPPDNTGPAAPPPPTSPDPATPPPTPEPPKKDDDGNSDAPPPVPPPIPFQFGNSPS